MPKLPQLALKHTSLKIADHLLDPYKLNLYLNRYPSSPAGPAIADFQPWEGYAGTLMVIAGSGFDEERLANQVEVGGKPARVIAAEPNRLTVITHHQTRTGPVKVTVAGNAAKGVKPKITRPVSMLEFPIVMRPSASISGAGPRTQPVSSR